MPDGYRYRAFVTYSHEDRRWARWLMRRLERYRVPGRLAGTRGEHGEIPATLAPIFRDREELPSGGELSERIEEALRSSEALILIASPAAARSHWVNEEVKAFRKLGRDDRIFAFVIDGDPGVVEGDGACFPPSFLQVLGEDAEPTGALREPLAADARDQGDGRGRAFGKLVAGLLGISYGELERREIQRRQKRLVAITAASLAGVVLTASLAIAAYLAREDAERRRAQAEGLLGFMVGDLRESLEPLGRLDLLDKVGDQAMTYFSSVKPGDLTDEGLSRQAQTLTQIGEVRLSQGRRDEALASFLAALDRSRELAQRHPGDGERLFDRGQAEFWVGYVPYTTKDLAATRPWFEAYLETSENLVALDPAREDWQIELAYARHNLAVLDLDDGRLEAAAAAFDKLVQTWEALDCPEPRCVDIKFDLADAYTWQGLAALRRGALEAFSAAITGARATYGDVLDLEPNNRLYQAEYANETNDLARAEYWLGRSQQAEDLYDESLALSRALHAHDPQNQPWLDQLYVALADRAEFALALGRKDEAVDRIAEFRRLLAGNRSADLPSSQSSWARARILRLEAVYLVDTREAALDALDQGRSVLDGLTAGREQEALSLDTAEVLVHLRYGDRDAARQTAAALLPALERLMDEEGLDPRRTTPWVRLVTHPELDLYDEAAHGARLEAIRETGLAIPNLWPSETRDS